MGQKKKSVSLKSIAAEAGVSTSLVSFVLNGKAKQHRVNEQVAKRVRQIAKEMNYKPNAIAKSLRNGKSTYIGVVVSDISNIFFAQAARFIETAAEKYNYSVQFASTDENKDRTEKIVDQMLYKGMDGIILVPCEGSESVVEDLISRGTPFVLFDRNFPDIQCNFVCLNNFKAGYDITKHMIESRRNKIAIIAYDFNLKHMQDRIEGYKEAMKETGNEDYIHIKYVDHQNLRKSCEKAVKSIIDENYNGILFATNKIGTESLFILNSLEIKIPDEVSVACFDGGNVFELFYAPVTHIEQPLEIMAQKAVDILVEQIEAPISITQSVEAVGSLITRESTRKITNEP